jgi:hypothetical protein
MPRATRRRLEELWRAEVYDHIGGTEPCGRTSMKIQEVAGRADHLRKIRGVLFTPVAVEELLRGRIQQKAKLNDGIDPRVIVAEHGWWFPEIKDEGHGWDIANVNILTDNAYETLDPAIGSTNLRVCLCSIAPVAAS